LEVLDLFVPHLNEFHFVDMLDEMHFEENHYGMSPFIDIRRRQANKYEYERFESNKNFNFIDRSTVKNYNEIIRERYSSGLDQNDRGRVTFIPLHEKETYETDFNLIIDIYKYRDDGYSVFRNLIYNKESYDIYSRDDSHIYRYDDDYNFGSYLETNFEAQKRFAVFFYRGDSQGGGGSGFYWLSAKYLTEVLDSIEEGGFLVTDGSNYSDHWYRNNNNINFEEAIRNIEIINYNGYSLRPLGFLRERHESTPPTMVFQKSKIR